MRKLTALRQHLIDANPLLARDPGRLLTFIEDGHAQFARGRSLSHGLAYTAQLVLTDYAGTLDAVMLPLLDWLSVYQPDLAAEQAVSFEAEILNHDAIDLALRVQLTERVVVDRDCATGQLTAEHRMPAFPREECPDTHWRLLTKGPGDAEPALAAEWNGPGGGDGA
ncbi:phage tail protein [Chromohalobacter sp.]|uniref:phage tail protein n=1 Tax=Chromohalobacter sp. TaxID=50740 RepID=UPI0032424008